MTGDVRRAVHSNTVLHMSRPPGANLAMLAGGFYRKALD